MEQAYRRLKSELESHPLVDSVETNYYFFKVFWKSGIKEKLILKKYDNDGKYQHYLRSKYRPHFLPNALWWDHLSNGKKPQYHYLENVEFEDNVDQYSNLVNWKWSDFKSAGFYEQLITIHEILQYVIDNGWKEQRFPENTLINSIQMVYNEGPKPYQFRRKKGYKIRGYNNKERPGEKILQHFMPYGYFGYNDPYYYMDGSNLKNRRRIYLAIRNIVNNNKIKERKGRKQFLDFNYANILKYMRDQYKSVKISPYKFRQIGLYKTMIKDFGLDGKSLYDPDPLMGELSLAAHVTETPYYFRKTTPFDEYYTNLSSFLNSECQPDQGNRRYDFGIFDCCFRFNKEVAEDAWNDLQEKVDLAIIFIPNEQLEEWSNSHPEPHDKLEMKVSKNPAKSGHWLFYYP